MEHRNELVGHKLVEAAILAFMVLLLIAVFAEWSDQAAAWAQAFGTILAVGVTGGLAVWEARQRSKDERERAADRLLARVALFEHAMEVIEKFHAAQVSRDRDLRGPQRAVRFMVEALRQVQFVEMPNAVCVRKFAAFLAGAEGLVERIDAHEGQWIEGAALDTSIESAARMRKAIEAIRAEALRSAAQRDSDSS